MSHCKHGYFQNKIPDPHHCCSSWFPSPCLHRSHPLSTEARPWHICPVSPQLSNTQSGLQPPPFGAGSIRTGNSPGLRLSSRPDTPLGVSHTRLAAAGGGRGSPWGPPSAATARAAAGKERRLAGGRRGGPSKRSRPQREARRGGAGWAQEAWRDRGTPRRGACHAWRGGWRSLAGSACAGSAAAASSACWPPCWGCAGAAGTAPTSSWTAASAPPSAPRGPAARLSASKWSAPAETWWKLCSPLCCPTAPCPCEYGPQDKRAPGGGHPALPSAGAGRGVPRRDRRRGVRGERGAVCAGGPLCAAMPTAAAGAGKTAPRTLQPRPGCSEVCERLVLCFVLFCSQFGNSRWRFSRAGEAGLTLL